MSSNVNKSPREIFYPILKIPYQIDHADRFLGLPIHLIPCFSKTLRCRGDIINLLVPEKLRLPVPFNPDKITSFQQGCDKEAPASKGIVQHYVTRICIGPDKITSKVNRFLRRMDDLSTAFRRLEICRPDIVSRHCVHEQDENPRNCHSTVFF